MNLFSGRNPLARLQSPYAVFVGAPFLFLYALAFLNDVHGSGAAWFSILLIAVGVYSSFVVRWAQKRPLDVTNSETLAASYRAAFFLEVGSANLPILASSGSSSQEISGSTSSAWASGSWT